MLILTDMFGGTPSNISYSFIKDGRVDVVSSVNLPILMEAVKSRKRMNFTDLSKHLESYGRKSITIARDTMKGNPRTSVRHSDKQFYA